MASGGAVKNDIMLNQQLAEELHKLIIREFEKCKVYSSFKSNLSCFDLADIQLMSKFNEGIRFILCVVDIYRKHTGCFFERHKIITITNTFQNMLYESSRRPNKILVNKGSEFF